MKRAELEKELKNVKAAIDRHKSNLAQIPDAIKQKKQELLKSALLLITMPSNSSVFISRYLHLGIKFSGFF